MNVLDGQWLEELGDMIAASVESSSKMHPASYFSEHCRKETHSYTGLNVQNSQWLEELENMLEATVKGLQKKQSFSAYCNGRPATA